MYRQLPYKTFTALSFVYYAANMKSATAIPSRGIHSIIIWDQITYFSVKILASVEVEYKKVAVCLCFWLEM